MRREDVKSLLEMLEAERLRDRAGWVSASCLFAPWRHETGEDTHPSFGISVGEQSYFNCFSCQVRGPIYTLPTTLTMMSGQDYAEIRKFITQKEGLFVTEKKRTPILEVIPISVLLQFSVYETLRHGLSKKSVREWDLRYDPREDRIIFPIYDRFKRLVGIRGRYNQRIGEVTYRTYDELLMGDDPKTCGIWYGMHFPLDETKKLILVEGERDTILLKQVGIKNVWGAMGASLSDGQIETLRGLKIPIVTFFDNDRAGKLAQAKVVKNIKGLTPLYHIKDYLGVKDPAESVERHILIPLLKTLSLIGA